MNYDSYGQAYTTSEELCELLYRDPTLDLSLFKVTDPHRYNTSVSRLFAPMPVLGTYKSSDQDLATFDRDQQNHWRMPELYQNMDIASWVLEQCSGDAELQRCGQELLLYQERDLFPLLCYMKYLVDTMRENGIVWGVGRGSSVASFVLYKIGIHKINSLYYDLDPQEFLK